MDKKIVLPCMAVCDVYISSAVYSQHRVLTEVFMDSTFLKEMFVLEKWPWIRCINSDEENSCRFEEQRKETVYTRHPRD